MKHILKLIIGVMVIVISCFLGIILLTDFKEWKIMLFAAICPVIGTGVYKLLRIIDKRWE